MKKGGRVTVRVTAASKATAAKDADREAAKYALSLGGTVRVNDQARDLKAIADLPHEPFRLTGVTMEWVGATDAGLTHLEDCKNLIRLDLHAGNATDAVTDAGIANFKNCKNLIRLCLDGTAQVDDVGLAYFKDCKNIDSVGLNGTLVTDDGMAQFQNYPKLVTLHLNGDRIGNAGLACLSKCKGLQDLDIAGTQVSDLTPLKGLELTWLSCAKTEVTDLSPLHAMPLHTLNCDFVPERDAKILRSITTLETINGKPAAEFWKELDANQTKPSSTGAVVAVINPS